MTANPNGEYPAEVWCTRGQHYITIRLIRQDKIGRNICSRHGVLVGSRWCMPGGNPGWFGPNRPPPEKARNLKTADRGYELLHNADKNEYHRKLQGVTCGFCTGHARRPPETSHEGGLERRNPGNAVYDRPVAP